MAVHDSGSLGAFSMNEEMIKAYPAKAFFVRMLTRDIGLQDAILDLLDNCVDAIIRGYPNSTLSKKPYDSKWARITLNDKEFSVSDNCGGISKKMALESVFVMGRRTLDSQEGTVGIYGIGMKRAIFKVGRLSIVTSDTAEDHWDVTITPSWMDDESDWDLPLNERMPCGDEVQGTTIVVQKLNEEVAQQFQNESFSKDLIKTIRTHYALILEKGFSVSVNGHEIRPRPVSLLSSESGLQPYVYKGTIDEVDVELAVGFYKPIPSQEEVDDEESMTRTADDAGWTICCNDRVVVYKDKTILTGWGDASVPRYHNQFIAITGLVQFRSKDPQKLPMGTTKRGIDGTSTVYLEVKQFMREGMKMFTDYTNRWKGQAEREKEISAKANPQPIGRIVQEIPSQEWTPAVVGRIEVGQKYRPNLPKPIIEKQAQRISFVRMPDEVQKVSMYLFEKPNASLPEIGNGCFDYVLRRI